jgi:DNA-binding transcriptional LysR family regulator
MNLRQLEAFRLVILTGTTVSAARVLNLTQPAVSKLIAEFQRSVGVTLFKRENGRLIPTAEAMALYAEVDRAFSVINNITHFANRIRNVERGHIDIITMPSLAFNFTARGIAKIAPLFPTHTFNVTFGDEGFGVERLLDNRADLVILLLPTQLSGVDIVPLVDVRSVCIIPRGHPLSTRTSIDVMDLEGEPLILVHPRYLWRHKLDEIFHRAGFEPVIRAETTSGAFACGLASQGVGIAIVNELMANEVTFQNAVIRPFTPNILQSIGIAIVDGKPKPPILMAMIDSFQSVAAEYI